ncbi:MAG: TonB-dependent receptor [Saprospiraceae bacterium]|nr:TonB-dependent receptor [Saprospiraceae bacterium]MCF8248509.1 TonB-dependent receptor [Saprospiraceae bacterium]MCF8280580.1 TonB-dependent receptor [Bacteroidales bacterium]MCF8310243.1 TonB-dependent receptor [Saprospiraceae bacterium]MCF8439318.1 TonB-dependent receptor [Saprospiraceae bacterium]
MKKSTGLVVLLLSFFLTSSTFANKETGTITGLVLGTDNQPISFANVLLYSAIDSSLVKAEYTADDGLFNLQNISAGRYWLNVSFVGLTDYNSDVFELATGQNLNLQQIKMSSKGIDLAQVTVTTKKPLVEVHPDKTVFNVEGSINATGNNAMELLRKSPGVVVDNNDNIIMSGKGGVRVYIDGKPTQLSANDLAAYLKTIQSTDIATIELITNPSARWDAEGNAGIINIRMKKDKRLGGNGNVNLGYATGMRQNYNGSVSGNYRNKLMNTFGSYSFNDGEWLEIMDMYREQNGVSLDQKGRNDNHWRSNNFKFGNDFFINDKNTVGFLVNGYENSYDDRGNIRTPITTIGGSQPDSTLISKTNTDGKRQNYNFNLNYRFDDAKGKIWNIDADYGFFKNDNSQVQPNMYLDGDGSDENAVRSERNYHMLSPTNIDIYTLKIDHERPFLKGQLGAGIKLSYVKTDNDFNFFNVLEGKDVVDVDRTNFYTYTENVNAAYTTYSQQFGKWGIQLGLRAEQTNSEGDLKALKDVNDENVKRDYLNFFPSGGLTYNMSEKHSFQLNYSRRIDRPNYQDLNPFEYRLDELTFQKGNPFIRPQYTNNLQLSHTFMQMMNTSFSFSHTSDQIERIVDVSDVNPNAAFITWKNLAEQNNYSLSIGSPIPITKWWNGYVNLNGYRTDINANLGEGKVVDVKIHTFNGYMQHTFTLPKDINFEVSGWYNSPSIWGGTFKMEDMWAVDAGISKKLLKGKATLKLSVDDIFYTQKWNGASNFGDLSMSINGRGDSRRFKANFSYRFGNEQVKASRRRSTGLEDEKNRIKN